MTLEEKLREIREHPEKHQHTDIGELTRCAWNPESKAIDMVVLDAHAGWGPNGKCDVKTGPCACGAWH